MAGTDGGVVKYFADRTETQLLPGAGPPRMLVRIDLSSRTVRGTSAGAGKWLDAPSRLSWLWDDHGEEVTEAEAARIAAGWGISLPGTPAPAKVAAVEMPPRL